MAIIKRRLIQKSFRMPRVSGLFVYSGSVIPPINFNLNPRMTYFDRSIIRSNWSAINRTPLTLVGVKVMYAARNSIKTRAGKKSRYQASPKGTPPYSHMRGKTARFKQIFSKPNSRGTSVIVGMVGYNPADPVPGAHELGLRLTRSVIKSRKRKRDKRGRYTGGYDIQRQRQMVKYPKRPFMVPALHKVKTQFPTLWKNAVNHARASRAGFTRGGYYHGT